MDFLHICHPVKTLCVVLCWFLLSFTGHKYYIWWDGVHYLRRIVHYFNWSNITILGHSLGGGIAFLYSAIYPKEVKKYISIDLGKILIPIQYFFWEIFSKKEEVGIFWLPWIFHITSNLLLWLVEKLFINIFSSDIQGTPNSVVSWICVRLIKKCIP